ncbi:hypothetical protein BaRGS_00021345 [Batillaria attramentaria]|uniref:V-SNARE coiled-coil homology domain-containing protein n=1 Tax=Batillaria attramentaria TaxID=370345 RepID=A0ABD0KK45_9CAEN
MPPKFARIPGSSDVASSSVSERRGLLDGDSDDEDFFLRGPRDNVNKVVERGDRLEDLQDKSDSLAGSADMFRSRSKSLHSSMWWKNCRMRILLAIVILIIVLVITIPIIVHFTSDSEDNNDTGGK